MRVTFLFLYFGPISAGFFSPVLLSWTAAGNRAYSFDVISFRSQIKLEPRQDCGRHGGLMVSALDSGSSGPGWSPGQGHCVVFLGKTRFYCTLTAKTTVV